VPFGNFRHRTGRFAGCEQDDAARWWIRKPLHEAAGRMSGSNGYAVKITEKETWGVHFRTKITLTEAVQIIQGVGRRACHLDETT
jgi:hypothetical protein